MNKQSFYILLIYLLGTTTMALANNGSDVLQKKIQLQVDNTSLTDVLKELEQITGASFAYKHNDINAERKVSLHISQTSLENILKIILYDDGVLFSGISSHVVIYQPENNSESQTGKSQIEEPVRDTIWTQVINTKNIIDTSFVVIADTIRYFDTVEVKRYRRVSPDFDVNARSVIAVEYGAAFELLDLSLSDNPNMQINSAYSINQDWKVMIGKYSKNWEIKTGIGLNTRYHSIDYTSPYNEENEKIDTVTYYITHTDSSYIALPGIDTTWFYKDRIEEVYATDKIVETKTITNSNTNSNNLYYLQIPIRLSYRKKINKKTWFVAGSSMQTMILLNRKAYRKVEYYNPQTNILKDIGPVDVYLSMELNVGFDFELTDNLFVHTSGCMGYALSHNLESDFISPKSNPALGLKVGIKKYF